MSSEYYRPTHTFEDGAYNATQVRLYGLQAARRLEVGDIEYQIEVRSKSKGDGGEKKYSPLSLVSFQTQMAGIVVLFTISEAEEKLSAGVIFGYAYEGHCYDLPKPKIMLIPAVPDDIPADDCGFEAKQSKNYRVWVVDKLDKCAEIELNQGFVEQIVLEANLPGQRSPRSYSATMQVAHRSGRLTE